MSSEQATNVSGRAKRQVKPRIVMVDGQAVLRLNSYDIDEGEPSVFARELGGASGAEQAARSSRAQQATPVARAPRGARAPPKRQAPAEQKKRPPKASDVERRRAELNERIRADAAASEARRAHFLREHAQLFGEFGARIPSPAVPSAPAGSAALARKIEADVARASALRPRRELTVELRDYQQAGLRWLATAHARGHSAILGDEMGLGKTLQTIAFLAHLKFDLGLRGASLVIAPLSCLSSWVSECRRFCPALRVVKLHSSEPAERERLKREVLGELERFDVVITTYEMAKAAHMHSLLAQRTWWRYVVVDEGHVLKNEGSLISRAVRGLHCQHALLLTGTPLQNDMHELWALLNFLFPDIFPDSAAFDCAFKLHGGRRADEVDKAKLLRAHALLRPLMLRRVKTDVEKRLPPKLETTIECPLSDMQLFWYKRLLLRDHSLLGALEAEAAEAASASGTDWRKLQNLLMQLRKVCDHPYLIDGAENVAHAHAGSREYATALVQASGKLAVLDRLLRALHAGGHRVVLFSQYCMMLDLLEEYCFAAGWAYRRLDGSTNRVQRTVNINSFNAPGSKIFLFLMSTRAGGLGINCQTADTCVLFDSDWNPQADLQAAARVHRIGQTKPVHVYRLVSSGTVEARILQHAEKKLYLDRMVNQDSAAAESDGAGGESGAPSEGELLSALKFGTQVCFRSEHARAPTDEEIGAIIDRTRTADASVGALRGGQARAAADFDASALAPISVRELRGVTYGKTDGKTFRECRSVEEIGEQWREHVASQRARTNTTVTEFVKGVGLVAVKRSNNYTMGEGMRLERALEHRAPDGAGRQIAGRDYEHEEFCLSCWDGGELVCCDRCPCAYHPGCLGLEGASEVSSFSWSCPHHSCATCARKASSAGGLLFRCAVCPGAWCEDHLEDGALVTGTCERFDALGFRPPKQGCYVLCSDECKAWALEQGLVDAESAEALVSAGAIIGATGVDTTDAAARAQAAAERRKQWVSEGDGRSAAERLEPEVAAALRLAAQREPCALEAASHAWATRAPELPEHMALMLHDIVFETELLGAADALNSKQAMAAEAAKARAALGAWRGPPPPSAPTPSAGAAHADGPASAAESPREEEAEALHEERARFFLRVTRELESQRPFVCRALCRALGMASVHATTQNKALTFVVSAEHVQSGQGQSARLLPSLLALFLARPLPELLYLAPEVRASGWRKFESLLTSKLFPSKRLLVVRGQVRPRFMPAAQPPRPAWLPPGAQPPQPAWPLLQPGAQPAWLPPQPAARPPVLGVPILQPAPPPAPLTPAAMAAIPAGCHAVQQFDVSAVRPISHLEITVALPVALQSSANGFVVLRFTRQEAPRGPETVTVGQLKAELCERTRVPTGAQRLRWLHFELCDDTLPFGALQPGQTAFCLHLVLQSTPAPPPSAPQSTPAPPPPSAPTPVGAAPPSVAHQPTASSASPVGRAQRPPLVPPSLEPIARPDKAAAPARAAAAPPAACKTTSACPPSRAASAATGAAKRAAPADGKLPPSSEPRGWRKSPRLAEPQPNEPAAADATAGCAKSGERTQRHTQAQATKSPVGAGSARRPSPVAMRPLN